MGGNPEITTDGENGRGIKLEERKTVAIEQYKTIQFMFITDREISIDVWQIRFSYMVPIRSRLGFEVD